MHRIVEDKFFYLSKNNESINCCVVLPGIQFGRGEGELKWLFDKLVEEEPVFEYFEDGNNIIPVNHVIDLAHFLLNIKNELNLPEFVTFYADQMK